MKKLFFALTFLASIHSFAQEEWTIEKCIEYASKNNLTVQQNTINQELFNKNLEQTYNAWLPTVSGYVDNNFTIGTYNPVIEKGYYQFAHSLGVQSSINIYSGGVVQLNKDKAALELEASKVQTAITVNDISLQIANYYLAVLLNKELKQVAVGNLNISKQLLDQNKKKLKAGSVAQSVVAQSESEVATNTREVVNAQIEIERALFNLAMLLQLNDYRDFSVTDVKIPDNINSQLYHLEDVVETAYQNQPAVKYAELQIDVATKETEIARTSLFPKITGTFNFGTNYLQYFNKRLRQDALLDQLGHNVTAVFGVGVSIPIWNQYSYKINIQKALINEDLMKINLLQSKQDILKNVQSAYFEVNSSYASYDSSKEAVKYAKISYDFAQKSYNAGVINQYDFNRSRNDLMVAESQMLQAKYNYVFKQKVLDFYAGIPITLD
ncbi:TolC family protein [Empedobacter stercoris]|uniref:TolC family protein n=1 Tax=Empedobacter stercoris TaxID=1628248 RepID=A0ABX1WN51_9FLAO|nr:TolC family protein [Empedobacter stercoris]MCA4776930.1 TolC family protein [Empedobacter stercoris]MCA4809828.1 TolC family protein [Empedobacter stercoris]NOJ76050.1 TolC family protein [Empedobacter stercoris]QNT14998.1 TolC family protein [Empedobacter stercoris]UWX66474.1 TolC family protein [Empedobacter stercoris]